ncbi:MAG: transporter, partial [Microbacteriaceae bacterium]|nr:transporter [Microbacteriaceae bacterium]
SHALPRLDRMTSIEPKVSQKDPATGRLLLLAAGAFVVGTGGFVIAGVLPGIAKSLDVPITTASLLITVYALVFAVGAPLISMVSWRMSQTTLMVIGLGLVAAGNILTVTLPTFELVIPARILGALGAAAFVPAATASAAAIAAPGRQGRAIALVTAGFTAATALGAPIGTALGALGTWHLSLWFVITLGVIVVAGIALLLRNIPVPQPLSHRERFAPLASGQIATVLLTTLLLVAGQYSAYTFFGTVQDRATGGNGAVLAILLFVYGAAATVGNLLAGILTDRVGYRRVLNVAIVVLVLDFAAMPFADGQLWSAILLIAVWGIAAWAAVLAVQFRVVQISPAAIAWNSSATFFGIALSGPLGALAITTVGAHYLTLYGVAVILLAAIVGEFSHYLSVRARGRDASPIADAA